MTKAVDWTFFSNYAHVLVCLADDPAARIRDIAADVGITERSAMRLITQLDEADILRREKDGRRNHYLINMDASLPHPTESHCTVGQLLEMLLSADKLRHLKRDQANWQKAHGETADKRRVSKRQAGTRA